MRVLVLSNMYPRFSGDNLGIFVQREVEALRRLEGAPEIEVFHVDTILSKAKYLTQAAALVKRAEAFQADMVHVHYGLTQIISRSWRGPTVVTLHGGDVAIPWQRAITKWYIRRSAAAIFVSEELRGLLPVKIPAEVISCGVNTERFGPQDRVAIRRELGWPDDRPVICFPSAPQRVEKDYGLFERTIKCLKAQGLSVFTVVLEGWKPDEVPRVLGGVDVLLFTSSQEGSPVTSKEAMCCGTRLVGTQVGDLKEQCEGLSGTRIMASRDPGKLAVAVRETLNEEAPSVDEAVRRFSIDEEARRVLNVYRDVMGKR